MLQLRDQNSHSDKHLQKEYCTTTLLSVNQLRENSHITDQFVWCNTRKCLLSLYRHFPITKHMKFSEMTAVKFPKKCFFLLINSTMNTIVNLPHRTLHSNHSLILVARVTPRFMFHLLSKILLAKHYSFIVNNARNLL